MLSLVAVDECVSQATVAGFGTVNQENVFKVGGAVVAALLLPPPLCVDVSVVHGQVCDQPHPFVIKDVLSGLTTAPDLCKSLDLCNSLWMDGMLLLFRFRFLCCFARHCFVVLA